jgi:TetR/AcrR family transcriptional regulator
MSDVELPPPIANSLDTSEFEPVPTARKRPKPGERRTQILQALAAMLEQPGADRITTAALAARLEVSEAALYRHFASKAQMFEGLIDFIEHSVFTLINQIAERGSGSQADPALGESGERQAGQIVRVLVQFAEKNPGVTRVMVGDAWCLKTSVCSNASISFLRSWSRHSSSFFKLMLRETVHRLPPLKPRCEHLS